MASIFNGKSTLYTFGDEYVSIYYIHPLHLIEDYDFYLYLVSLTTIGSTALYILNNKTNTLTSINEGTQFHSFNSDDKHLYFIDNLTMYVYNFITLSFEEPIMLVVSVANINVINNWIYYTLSDHVNFFRLNVKTRAREAIGQF